MTPHSYGVETLQVKRFKKTESESVLDNIVQEHPIALVYNGISHAVMMATPTDVSVFAKGFSLSEGILTSLKELYAIEVHESELGIEVNMTISSRAFAALKERRRMLVGRTGCGLCGIESLEQLQLDISKITIEPSKEWLEQIPVAISQLKDQQKITALTGGAHAAAWVVQGKIMALFEDVGRHNALDKLLGYLAQENYDTGLGFVVMTSRASYELIRKCAQLNIGLLASISAPTSMAIRLAKTSGLTLASFCRGDDFVLYT
ncbi:formate dehydrogenase accessory sulfurtransferase FdhD [Acinetobacter oleivorans]|uniref:formate dehydrogenase accessory sulfurtransferase FdhD n=1 Tax=Acinetobacter oleivorans TaxID=1148157 RepID=UPI001CD3C64F|nr:formate dehydrogenase accessory sulfurtransferase FdhD [Acinetobacter oleivorans]